MEKTGKTAQVRVTATETIELNGMQVQFQPGIYRSFSIHDAEDGMPEFILQCENRTFCANDLNEVLEAWSEYCFEHGPVKVTDLTRLG